MQLPRSTSSVTARNYPSDAYIRRRNWSNCQLIYTVTPRTTLFDGGNHRPRIRKKRAEVRQKRRLPAQRGI